MLKYFFGKEYYKACSNNTNNKASTHNGILYYFDQKGAPNEMNYKLINKIGNISRTKILVHN